MRFATSTLRITAVVAVIAALACGDATTGTETKGTAGQTNAPGAMSAEARSYLNAALDTMQKYSYYRATINWASVRTRAIGGAEAGHAQTYAATYSAIRQALADLGDHHSFLQVPVSPALASQTGSATVMHLADSLDGELLAGRYGYIRIPTYGPVNGGTSSQGTAFADTIQALIRAVDANAPCGWIVDLRHNSGGNMWPMLAGIGPVLGEGTNLGAFVNADNDTIRWYYTKGVAGTIAVNGQFPAAATSRPGYVLRAPNPPVAVITDRLTASSGEAIAVAFRGRPNARTFGVQTYGVPTANAGHPLMDGAYLWLMSALDADRTGATYIDALPPDQIVDSQAPPATDDAAALTAMNWLAAQTSCKN